jgi:N utilization substance protein A
VSDKVNKIKYDSDLMKLMALFESISGAKVKDAIANDKVTFVIEENDMGKAIGKNGMNIKKMEHMLKKRVQIDEFINEVVQFGRNIIHPLEVQNIEYDNGVVTISGKDTGTKSMLIGREHQHLNHTADLVKRYFDVKAIKVI